MLPNVSLMFELDSQYKLQYNSEDYAVFDKLAKDERNCDIDPPRPGRCLYVHHTKYAMYNAKTKHASMLHGAWWVTN